MLTYIFIGFVVVVALAPLLHFVPSKRQKQIADMRESAALKGLYVAFRQLPGERLDKTYRTGELIYYGKRLSPRVAGKVDAHHWIREEDGSWRAANWRVSLPQSLQSLPSGVVAASLDGGSCGVYWVESNDPEDVEQICAAVLSWSASLGGD